MRKPCDNGAPAATEARLVEILAKYNSDYRIDGILLQLPLPSHINERDVTAAIDPSKDVDGFHSLNIGQLVKKNEEPYFVACTPLGIIELLKESGVEVKGKECVVLGRSNIVVIRVFNLGNACG